MNPMPLLISDSAILLYLTPLCKRNIFKCEFIDKLLPILSMLKLPSFMKFSFGLLFFFLFFIPSSVKAAIYTNTELGLFNSQYTAVGGGYGAIALDTSGNVYLPYGYSGQTIVRKFDSNTLLPAKTYREMPNGGRVRIDSSNRIYTLGSSTITKYRQSGTYVTSWTTENAGDYFNDFTVANGNVYIVGYNSVEDADYVWRYDTNGNLVSSFASGLNGDIVVDSNGNIYITSGVFYGDSPIVRVFNSANEFVSSWGVDTPIYTYSSANACGQDICILIHNEEYTSGEMRRYATNGTLINTYANLVYAKTNAYFVFNQSGQFFIANEQGMLAKYDSDGTLIIKAGKYEDVLGNGGLVQDSLGNVYIEVPDVAADTGRINKIDTNGNIVDSWTYPYRIFDASYGHGIKIYMSDDSHIYISTNSSVDGTQPYAYIRKYTVEGVFVSETLITTMANANITDFVVDASGNLVVTYAGESPTYASHYDSYISKFNSNGTFNSHLLSTLSNGTNSFNTIRVMTYNADGNLTICENANGTIQTRSITTGSILNSFVARFPSNNVEVNCEGLNVDSSNNVYVEIGTRTMAFTSSGSFIFQFDHRYGNEVVIDSQGNFIVHATDDLQKISLGYQVTLTEDIGTPDIVDTTVQESLKTGSAYGKNSSSVSSDYFLNNIPIVTDLAVNLTADRDWTNVVADFDEANSITVISGLNPVDAPGASATHSMYVTMLPGQTGTYICPSATVIGDVSTSCAGGYQLDLDTASNLSIVNIDGQDYWKIDGLTGTGALGISAQPPVTAGPLTLTPNSSPVSTIQQIAIEYTSSLGFVAGDRIQFYFEPGAGFDLGQCGFSLPGTPTTDANGDTVADGNGDSVNTVSGWDMFEYTFTDTIMAGPLSFCVEVESPATAGSYSVRLTDDNGTFDSAMYYVGDDNDVFVIANVAPSLSFNIRTLDDSADTNVCEFGTVSPSDAIPNYDNVDDGASECGYALAVGTNASNGFTLTAQATSNLRSSTGTEIAFTNPGDVFVPGVEAYGYANITSATSGRNVATGVYDQAITRTGWWNLGNNAAYVPVGSREQILSFTNGVQYMAGGVTTDVTQVMHGLVIGSGTPAGYYTQLIDYVVTANF
jgi:hypothetical protein